MLKVIIKPISSAGSDGVYCCTSVPELKRRFQELIGATNLLGVANSQLVVQEFLEGREYVVDAVSLNGVHKIVNIWQYVKHPANGAGFVYFGVDPLSGDQDIPKQLVAYQKQVLDALGFIQGASHGEIIMTPDGPCLVEVGARCHGGEGTWVPLVNKMFGTSQVKVNIDSYLDHDAYHAHPGLPIIKDTHGTLVYLVSYKAGKIVSYPYEKQIKKLKSFLKLDILVKVGDTAVKTISAVTNLGMVLLVGNLAQVKKDIDAIRTFENKPDFIVIEGEQ